MATSIGASTQAAQSIMKQEYKQGEMDLNAALALAVKVLAKTCDATALTPDKRTRAPGARPARASPAPRRAPGRRRESAQAPSRGRGP